jgi:hypothetical protein
MHISEAKSFFGYFRRPGKNKAIRRMEKLVSAEGRTRNSRKF